MTKRELQKKFESVCKKNKRWLFLFIGDPKAPEEMFVKAIGPDGDIETLWRVVESAKNFEILHVGTFRVRASAVLTKILQDKGDGVTQQFVEEALSSVAKATMETFGVLVSPGE